MKELDNAFDELNHSSKKIVKNMIMALHEIQNRGERDFHKISQIEMIKKPKLQLNYEFWRLIKDKNTIGAVEEHYDLIVNEYDAALAEIKAIHESNIPSIHSNIELKAKITELFDYIGIHPSYKKASFKDMNIKTETVTSGYISDLDHFIPTSDNFERVQSELHIELLRIKESKANRILKIERENEKFKVKHTSIVSSRPSLLVKYVSNKNGDDGESFMDFIVAKNLYLSNMINQPKSAYHQYVYTKIMEMYNRDVDYINNYMSGSFELEHELAMGIVDEYDDVFKKDVLLLNYVDYIFDT